MKREITCIVCPRGCRMTADIHEEQIVVTGHSCNRGEKHAVAEILHPVRSLTSIVHNKSRFRYLKLLEWILLKWLN